MAAKMARVAGAIDKVIGARIRIYRQRRNLSQTELGEKLGLTFQQIQKYESGANRVSAGRLLDIARLLSVPLLQFYPDDGPSPKAAQGDDFDMAAVSAFMAGIDGWRLCRAFLKIDDARVRKKVFALVEDLAAS